MIDDPSPWMAEYVTLYRQAMLHGRAETALVDAEELDAHLAELHRLRTLHPEQSPAQILQHVLIFLAQRRRQRQVPPSGRSA
jgi:hypothetical protein